MLLRSACRCWSASLSYTVTCLCLARQAGAFNMMSCRPSLIIHDIIVRMERNGESYRLMVVLEALLHV